MKKIILFIVLVLAGTGTACNFPSQILAESTPTETPFMVPDLPGVTHEPTATPFIVTPTPFPTDEPLFYTVGRGDTLTKIADKYNLSVEYLAKINSLENQDRISAGQVLLLKTKEEVLERAYSEKGKKVLVPLSEQKAYALENRSVIKEFVVSTGVADHPTLLGKYQIYVKLKLDRMIGPGYDLPNVPWVMYFFKGYSLHGTYWHHNFGHPMSHGCVNMQTSDAEWVFNWSEVGTTVWIVP